MSDPNSAPCRIKTSFGHYHAQIAIELSRVRWVDPMFIWKKHTLC